MRKTIYFQIAGVEFRKWDMLKTSGGQTAIVIKSFKEAGAVTYTCYP